MKLMFISDIHGSSLYAQKAIDTYKQEKADKLIILGDILYHGPRNDLPEEYAPKKVISLLNAYKKILSQFVGIVMLKLIKWFWIFRSVVILQLLM